MNNFIQIGLPFYSLSLLERIQKKRIGCKCTIKTKNSYGFLIFFTGKLLLLKRKYSLEFVKILCGNYTCIEFIDLFSKCQNHEIEMLNSFSPVEIWRKVFSHDLNDSSIIERIDNIKKNLNGKKGLIKKLRNENILRENPYLYDIPKGRKNEDETSINAALRELREETGIVLDKKQVKGRILTTYRGEDNNLYNMTLYVTEVENIDIKLEDFYTDFVLVSDENIYELSSLHRLLYTNAKKLLPC